MIGTMSVVFVFEEGEDGLSGHASNDSETVPMLAIAQSGNTVT